jgi:GrpB-like predicted nucleotidyltransferase (UPF0157 family)
MNRRQPIEIVDPDPRWDGQFRELAVSLRQALGDRALRIDHIGSTSVPRLPAKPIVDVQVTVETFDGLREQPIPAGFRWSDYAEDHAPPGRDLPPEQWAKRFMWCADPPRANVHFRIEGRANQRYALLFRDYLRTHPSAASAYAMLKQALARIVRDDIDAYLDVKDPACDIAMVGAEEWARATSWRPGPSDG